MHKAPLALVLVLAAAGIYLATRGGSDDPHDLTERGYTALGQSDFGEAAESFGRALRALPATDPGRARAAMGLVEALAHIDPGESRDRFLAWAQTAPDVHVDTYRNAATWMHQGGGSSAAVDVLEAGIARFPASGVELEAQKQTVLGDVESPEEIEKLESMGYLGGD